MNAPAFLFIKYSSVNVVKLCTYEIFFCHKTFKIFLLSSSNGDLKRFFFLHNVIKLHIKVLQQIKIVESLDFMQVSPMFGSDTFRLRIRLL